MMLLFNRSVAACFDEVRGFNNSLCKILGLIPYRPRACS